MSKQRMTMAAVVGLGVLASAGAGAAPLPGSLGIDFRTSAWSGANGQNSFTVGNVTASINNIIVVPFLGPLDLRDLSQSTNAQTGGLGVNTFGPDEPDEVDHAEVLTISFSGGQDLLTGIWITKLYPEYFRGAQIGEYLQYSINGGAFQTLGPSNESDGGFYVDFGGYVSATSVRFKSPALGSDFAVAGFTVPEPASLALLGTGLLGLSVVRRRRRPAA